MATDGLISRGDVLESSLHTRYIKEQWRAVKGEQGADPCAMPSPRTCGSARITIGTPSSYNELVSFYVLRSCVHSAPSVFASGTLHSLLWGSRQAIQSAKASESFRFSQQMHSCS
jgi:hypothetical protein